MRLTEYVSAPRRPWLVVAFVPGSKKGTWHRVRLHESGLWTCDCKGYNYRQQCRHLDKARVARAFTAEMVEALV